MSALVEESRDALRSLLRSRGFFALASGCLALGLAANALMFGVVDAYFLRAPALVRDPDEVLRLYFDRHVPVARRIVTDLASYPVFTDIRDGVPNVLTAAYYHTFVSEGSGANAAKLRAGLATQEYFRVLDVPPAVGRSFQSEDARVGASPVAVLSDHLWRHRFGGRASAIGQDLLISGRRFTIIGVLPRGFIGVDLEPVDVWLPLEAAASDLIMPGYLTRRGAMAISLLARLGPGVSGPSLESAATHLFRSGMSELRGFDSTDRVFAAPLLRERGPKRGDQARVSVWLGGVSVAVLIIACLDCAALMVVRALRRQREFAVRIALGASARGLLQLLIVETAVLTLVSALAAVAMAGLGAGALRGLLLPQDVPAGFVSFPRLFGFTLIVGLGVGFVVSVPLLLQVANEDLTKCLRMGPRSGMASRSAARIMTLVGQIALTMALLSGAGLFASSLRNARALDMGFDPDAVLAINIDFAGMTARPGADSAPAELYRRLEDAVGAVPGVTSVAVATSIPFQYLAATPVSIPGRDSTTLPKQPVFLVVASEGHLRTMGLRLREGRWFDFSDYGSGAGSAVISETMAKTYWPGESPLGKCLVTGEPQCRQVVGVVADTRRSNLREDPVPQLYIPETKNPALTSRLPRTLLVRTARPGALGGAVRQAIHSVDKTLAYVSIQQLNDLIAPKVLPWRLGASMLTAFGVLALVLTAVGLYGNVSWMVAERTHELGVRIALGAPRAQILRIVFTDALLVVAAGTGLGALIVFLGGGSMEPLLFGVRGRDPIVVGSAASIVALVTLAACCFPLRRATRVDPLEVLRGDLT